MQSFPKIWALGSKPTANIFKGPVEITEKLDGSQFNFGKKDGQLWFRSKGAQIFPETCPDLFRPSVAAVLNAPIEWNEGWSYHGEALCRPRHNTLQYSRVPKGNTALFGIVNEKGRYLSKYFVDYWAEKAGLDSVKTIFEGDLKEWGPASEHGPERMEWFRKLIAVESQLGGALMEGVVVKNYTEKFILGTQIMPVFGKYVSEQFKEKHSVAWVTGKDRLEELLGTYRSEVRWNKAIQHLSERGELTSSPKDIGPLLKEIQIDLETEEADDLKERLFALYRKDWLRKSIAGFPEWYKERLLNQSLEGAVQEDHDRTAMEESVVS